MQDDLFSIDASFEEPEADESGTVVISVAECHSLVNDAVSRLGYLQVRGEVQKPSIVRNSMAFFELKDADGQQYVLECALFSYSFQRYSHILQDGMEVTVRGRISLYKTGRLRMIADRVEPYGEGAWRKALEELKKKLAAKGYFDEERKRPIPKFVNTIGLITSPQGQAISDFRKNLGEYGFRILFYGVWVEGDKAEQSVASAIRWFNQRRADVDVLVVIRGGGGFENLKAYNAETIAEEIAGSRIPVITGIGHERDVSIADYVADKALSTPTATAIFLKTQREDLMRDAAAAEEHLFSSYEQFLESIETTIQEQGRQLEHALERVLERQRFLISTSAERLYGRFGAIFESFHMVERQFLHAIYTFEQRLYEDQKRLAAAQSALTSLNPENILQRGYSVVRGPEGTVIKTVRDLRKGDQVRTTLYRGSFCSRIEDID